MSQAGMTKTLQLIIDATKAHTGADSFVHASEKVTHAATGMEHGSHACTEAFDHLWEKAKEVAGALGLLLTAEKAFEAATSFADHLQKVSTTTGLTGEALNGLGEDLEKLSHRVPITVESMLDISKAAGQLGSKGREDVYQFTEAVSLFAGKTGEAADESATAFGKILRLSHEGVAGAMALAQEANGLRKEFRATGGQILDMSAALQLATEDLGLTSTATNVYGAVLVSLGKDSTRASMAIGQAYREIDRSIRQGGEALQDLEAITGMTGDQLKQTFETDPPKVFREFLSGLRTVVEHGGSAENVLSHFNLQGHMLLSTLVAMATNLEQVDHGFVVAGKAVKEPIGGFDLWSQKFKLLKNDAESLGKALGDHLLGPTDLIVQALRDLLDPEFKATEGAHQLADSMRVVGAAIGVVLAFQAAGKIASIADALLKAAKGGVALSSSLTPALVALTAIAAFEGGSYLYNEFEDVQAGAAKTIDFLARMWEKTKYGATVAFGAIGSSWDELMTWFQQRASESIGAVGGALQTMGQVANIDSLKSAGSALAGVAKGLKDSADASQHFDITPLLPLTRMLANMTGAELQAHKLGKDQARAFYEGFSDYSRESHQASPDAGAMFLDVEKMAKALEASGDEALKAAAEALRKRRDEVFDSLQRLPFDTKMKLASTQYEHAQATLAASLKAQLASIQTDFANPNREKKSFLAFLGDDVKELMRLLGMLPEAAHAAEEATHGEGNATEHASESHEKFNKAMDGTLARLSALTPEMKTARDAVEEYERKLATAADRAGLSDHDREQAAALDQLRELSRKANYSPEELSALEQKTKATVELAQKNAELRQMSDDMAQAAGDEFEAWRTGAKSAEQAVHDLAVTIEKELVQALVMKPAMAFLSNAIYGGMSALSGMGAGAGSVQGGTAFSGFGGGGAGAGVVTAALGNAFEGGSVVPYADGGIAYNQAMFAMRGGHTGTIAEGNVPEVVAPLARDGRGRLGVTVVGGGGGGGTTNQYNVKMTVKTNDAGSFKRNERQILQRVKRGMR